MPDLVQGMSETIPGTASWGQPPEPLIHVREARYGYPSGGFELRVGELRVDTGDQMAITGRSGAGKTTLLHLLAGLLVPDRGSVRFHGFELGRLSGGDRQDLRVLKVGLVFQEFELLEYLDVLDNVLLPYRISPILELTSDVRARAVSLVREVGLGDKLGRRPAQLSQGERQRVAVARALITRPAVVLGDEPTGNLDPDIRDQVMDILFEYATASGAPLVVVSHDREVVERFASVRDLATLS